MNQGKLMWIGVLALAVTFGASIEAQPLANYTFNDGTAKDVSGNGYDGIVLDTAVIVDDPERGKVLQINQSGMQVDGPLPISTSFTLSAWIKLDQPRTGRAFFGGPWLFRTDNQGGPPEHHWIEIRYPGASFLDKIDTRTGGNPQGQLDGQWHHLILILHEDGAFEAYFDGAPTPYRNPAANPFRAHDFGGAVGPLFFGTENAAHANAIKGYMDNIRIYNYAVGPDELGTLHLETDLSKAANPYPMSRAADVPRDVILQWTPSIFADTHNVYFGTVLEDVKNADPTSPLLIARGQDVNSVDVGRLEFGQTYFWRVDEVNAPPDLTVYQGNIWTFTVELYAYPVTDVQATASSSWEDMTPDKTIDGSGLDVLDQHSTDNADMWLTSDDEALPAWIQFELPGISKLTEMRVWNLNQKQETILGASAKDVVVEYSLDGEDWSTLGSVVIPQADGSETYTGSVIDLEGIAAKSVRLVIESNWRGILQQTGLSEVRFFNVPVRARQPQPVSGETNAHPSTNLSWQAGREAASHEVLIGTDASDLAPVGAVIENRYDTTPVDLRLDTTYYWKVNEVNEVESPAVWEGDLWTFSTQEFVVVEDFDRYTDNEGSRIYETWIDGWGDAQNGSQVGYDQAPFAELTIALGSSQSMPLAFDNLGAAYSEALRTFASAQDWSRFGITTLVVNFYAHPDNQGGKLYVKVNGRKVVFENAGVVTPPMWAAWKQWKIDLASLGVNLQAVTSLAIGVEGVGATGMIYVDNIFLYRTAPAGAKVIAWFEAESGTTVAPMSKYAGDVSASGGMYVGTSPDIPDVTADPPEDGIVTYSFTVPAGVYKVVTRVVTATGRDSFWVRIPNAVTNTQNHASGWIQYRQIGVTANEWQWREVHSSDDNNHVVEFTLAAGTHTLDIAYRDAGTLLDAIALVKLD